MTSPYSRLGVLGRMRGLGFPENVTCDEEDKLKGK
jgi:hypothetical protein